MSNVDKNSINRRSLEQLNFNQAIDSISSHIGNYLERNGLTVADFCESICEYEARFYGMRNRNRNPTLKTLVKYAAATNTKLVILFEHEQE